MSRFQFLRRTFSMLLCAFLIATMATPASAQVYPPYLESEAAILMDAETGQVLFEKNSHQVMYPASITKIMTGMLALTHLKPDQKITISQENFDSVPRDSSNLGLEPGEELTVEQALYALAMVSANEAANALGEAVSESPEEFAALMTETAHELGAMDTHFANASGLPDPEHYTTAYDMALITAQALKTPDFCKYFSTVNYYMLPTNLYPDIRVLVNHNKILGGQYTYSGVLMSKTGWTSAAMGTLVTAAKRGDTTLIVVTLKSQYLEDKYQDTYALLDYGLSQFQKTTLSGADLTAALPAEGLEAVDGQEYCLLLPTEMALSDFEWSINGAPDLASVRTQTEVTLSGSTEGLTLPELTLQLYRPAPEETQPPATEAPAETEAESATFPWAAVVIAIASLTLIIAVALIYRRQSLRVPTA